MASSSSGVAGRMVGVSTMTAVLSFYDDLSQMAAHPCRRRLRRAARADVHLSARVDVFPRRHARRAGAGRAAAGGGGGAHQFRWRKAGRLVRSPAWRQAARASTSRAMPKACRRASAASPGSPPTAPACWRCAIAAMAARPATPTEDGLIRDAEAAYDFARAHTPARAHRAVRRIARHGGGGRARRRPRNRRAHPRRAVHLRRRCRRRRLSFRARALVHEGQVPLGRAHRPRHWRRSWCCTASRTASCRSASAKRCSRWRASPSASCASRKAAMSISTITARRKWCKQFLARL